MTKYLLYISNMSNIPFVVNLYRLIDIFGIKTRVYYRIYYSFHISCKCVYAPVLLNYYHISQIIKSCANIIIIPTNAL